MSLSPRKEFSVDEVVTPSLERLIASLYSAVMYNLGELKLRGIPEVPVNITLARFNLGLLQVLQQKCRGNLTKEEEKLLSSAIESAEKAISAHAGNGDDTSDAARG